MPVELVIGPVQARIQGHFSPRRAAAREEAIKAFTTVRYAKLLADLDRLALDPPLGPRAADRPVTSSRPPCTRPTGRPPAGCG